MEKFSGPLSRRYGTALFESLHNIFNQNNAEFMNASEKLHLANLAFDKKTIKFFQNQSIHLEQKNQLLEEILNTIIGKEKSKFSSIIFNFLSLLVKNQRFSLVHPILDFYQKTSDKHLGITRAQIISARPMSSDILIQFEAAIKKNVQKKVVFYHSIDKTLQSGFVVKIGSVDIDASLKSFLSKLQESVS